MSLSGLHFEFCVRFLVALRVWQLCERIPAMINRLEGRGVFLNTGFVFSGDSSCDGAVVSPLSILFKFDVCVPNFGYVCQRRSCMDSIFTLLLSNWFMCMELQIEQNIY